MHLAHIRLSYNGNSVRLEHLYIAVHQHGATATPPEDGTSAGKRRNTPLIKTLTSRFVAWRRFRDSVRELSRLSDRELNDLGIGRADIASVVRQSIAG
jgi:uncharacterized protein YjiS (DUF1127 family)